MKYKSIVTLLLILLMVIGFSTNAIASEFKDWEQQDLVPTDKEWLITFNLDYDEVSANETTIFVKDRNGDVVEIELIFVNERSIKVVPTKQYLPSETYFLHIKDVTSAGNSHLTENILLTFTTKGYDVYSLESGETTKVESFHSFSEAVTVANNGEKKYIVKNQNQVVWAYDGVATSAVGSQNHLTLYSTPDLKGQLNFVSHNTEMRFLDSTEEVAKVEVANSIGYVELSKIEITPIDLVPNRSYYMVENDDFIHYVYQNNEYNSYIFGAAPVQLTPGEKYFSWDGKTFGEVVFPQYFQYASLRDETSYSAEQLNEMISQLNSSSPLNGLGFAFKDAEAEHNVNALFLLAHAIHESKWGTSKIATDKNNLFVADGNSSTYENAGDFHSFADSINAEAEFISSAYLTSNKGFYKGAFLGNKSEGMNVHFDSDPFWGQKIAGKMYELDKVHGQLDLQ